MLSIVSRLPRLVHKTTRVVKIQSHLLTGRKPWTAGYVDYRQDFASRAIRDPYLCERFRSNSELPKGYGMRLDERVIEYPWVISRLSESEAPLLDAGSTLNHSGILEFPALQNKPIIVYNLTPEQTIRRANVSYVYGDLRRTIFKDESFREIVCISTLEHIGMDNTLFTQDKHYKEFRPLDYRAVMHEFRRLLAPSGRLLLTVPYGQYQNCGWLQQFNYELLNDAIRTFDGTVSDQAFYRYTRDGWILTDARDCSNCEYYDYTRESNYDWDYAAAARAVACVELTK